MANDNSLYTLLETSFRAAGDGAAFVVPGGRTVTYKALSDDVGRMANALVKLGIKPGDRVMVQVEKSIENVVLYLATLKTGAVYNPLNTAYMPAELEYFIGDAEPTVIVMPKAQLAKIEKTATANKVSALTSMEADGSGSLVDLARQQPASHMTVPRADDDLASLLYTSGTTGRSKGAMLTHLNLSSNAQVLHKVWEFRKGDVLLHALPIFHTHGLFVALHTAFLNGSTMHWLTRFDLDAVLKLLPQSTVMMGVPTFYTRLLGSPAFTKDHCKSMRLFISGSAPLLAETHQEFEARTGMRILERYGMTEAGMITSNPYADGGRIAGSVGYALPGIELRIAEPDGRVLDGKRGRRAGNARAEPVQGLLAQSREDERGLSRRRLFHHRRSLDHGPGRARDHRRPRQGPHYLRRLQRLPQGDRDRDQCAARRRRIRRAGRAASRLRRGRNRGHHARRRRHAPARGPDHRRTQRAARQVLAGALLNSYYLSAS